MRCLALLLLLSSSLVAQQIKVVKLPSAVASLAQEFTGVTSVRELSDGRLLMTDPRDKGLVVADFRAGTVNAIGRKGQGPGEYMSPGPLFALPNDSTLMSDAASVRWLILVGS